MQSSTAAIQAHRQQASTIAFALALAAGYVDAVRFVALFGLFTAHVTGNLVLIGTELANPSHGVLIMLAGWVALPFDDARSLLALTTGVLGSAAMGVQSVATKIVAGSATPTTAMTGNVTQLVIDLVDMAWQSGGGQALRRRVHEVLGTVLSFAVGAVLGASAFRQFSMLALLLPIGMVAALVPLSFRSRTRRVSGAVHRRPPSER